MSIIVDLRDENWMSDTDLKKIISADLPNVDIYCGPATSKMPDITMAVIIKDLNQEQLKEMTYKTRGDSKRFFISLRNFNSHHPLRSYLVQNRSTQMS